MSTLYLTVGVSCSGKTTFSKVFCNQNNIIRLSSDECRAIVGTGEEDQSVSYKVFQTLFTVVQHLLNQGYDVMVDATNVSKKSRKEFVKIARLVGADLVAYVVQPNLTLDILLNRNSNRARHVPKEVIEKQLAAFEQPTSEEGFKDVYVIIE